METVFIERVGLQSTMYYLIVLDLSLCSLLYDGLVLFWSLIKEDDMVAGYEDCLFTSDHSIFTINIIQSFLTKKILIS